MKKQIKEALKRTLVYDVVQFVRERRKAKSENEKKRREIELWELSGRPVPPPHGFKEKVVREYGVKFSIKVLVETGTCFGDMIAANCKYFKEIYSIELDNALFERAKKKFERYGHISIYKGDSSEILHEILAEIDQPALFWLDAHYSEGITARGNLETPIMDEVNSILGHRITNHVMLIDDARLFTGEGDYPTVAQMKQLVSEKRSDLSFEIHDDVICIFPRADMS